MKKYLMAFSAIVLTTAGAIAGKASAKADATNLFYSTGPGGSLHCHHLAGTFSGCGVLTTLSISASQATISSNGGLYHRLYGTSTCSSSHLIQFNS